MTVADIQKRRDLIKSLATGRIESTKPGMEAASLEQGKMLQDVLRAISDGAENARELAVAAMKPIEIAADEWE